MDASQSPAQPLQDESGFQLETSEEKKTFGQKLQDLKAMGFTNDKKNVKALKKFSELDTVVIYLLRKQQKGKYFKDK